MFAMKRSKVSNSGSDDCRRSNVIMNDDIVCIVLSGLDINQLFASKPVSKQFDRCVQRVLREKRELSVGFNALKRDSEEREFKEDFSVDDWKRIDMTDALVAKGWHPFDSGVRSMDAIVRQFRGVKTLYLSKLVVSVKTIELFVDQFPQLHTLYVNDIHIKGPTDETVVNQCCQSLSHVKHLSLGYIDSKYGPFLENIIRNLPSLQSLKIWHFYPKHRISYRNLIDVQSLANCMPENMRSLSVPMTSMVTTGLDQLIDKCQRVLRLTIDSRYNYSVEGFDYWNRSLAMICDRLRGLKSLNIAVGNTSAESLAQSIAKLKNLQHLRLRGKSELIGADDEPFCFDTQFMSAYMRPMVSLRSLSLEWMTCSPNRWSNLAQMLPNVRRLSLDDMCYHLDCEDGYVYTNCNDCVYRCMDLVSKLPKLKHFIIGANLWNEIVITRQTLDLLATGAAHRLSLYWVDVDDLIHLVTTTLANKGRAFRLYLLPFIVEQLNHKMKTMCVQMPDRLIVGHVFDNCEDFDSADQLDVVSVD